MKKQASSIKDLIRERIYFFSEVLIVFFGIFIFLIPTVFIPYDESSGTAYGILFYLSRTILAFLAIVAFLYVANFAMEKRKKYLIIETTTSSSKSFRDLFNVKKSNLKYQMLYGVLLLFLVFIPLDYVTYLFLPEMIPFSANSLIISQANVYLGESYLVFIISAVIIQFSVAFYEEAISRGFLTNRGNDYVSKMSAVIISSVFFGMGHFAYIFNLVSLGYPIFLPFIWCIEAIIIGIILSMLVMRRRWIFPVIFAHAINNIISAHALWNYFQGNEFTILATFFYPILLVIGLVLFILNFPLIRDALSIGFKDLKTYFKNNPQIKEPTDHKIIRIMLDVLFGFLIFIIGYFLT
ncbi:MAG: CPBP family intramembrane metalloprotease [Promethearchaeota archaeon]|nr:MAG: CPBP family intramembrane metalloprotease [Candidatus Lokiarchaeota archaeon]